MIEELLWFVSGCTDGKALSAKGVNIWEGNGSREYLDKVGLGHRREGDLGPVYGFQWRHFGAEYGTCEEDYGGKGVDQLAQVIDKIKNNPTDRRIIMSAWNPKGESESESESGYPQHRRIARSPSSISYPTLESPQPNTLTCTPHLPIADPPPDLPSMALPPCHMFCQFYVTLPSPGNDDASERPKLSCLMYQRSCDLGLGVPFNIASYALLTHMIAHMTNTEPHEFILQMGDAHVYRDHVEPLKEQLTREPREFPKLRFARGAEEVGSIDGFRTDDFVVEGYKPMGKIEMKMSVSRLSSSSRMGRGRLQWEWVRDPADSVCRLDSPTVLSMAWRPES